MENKTFENVLRSFRHTNSVGEKRKESLSKL